MYKLVLWSTIALGTALLAPSAGQAFQDHGTAPAGDAHEPAAATDDGHGHDAAGGHAGAGHEPDLIKNPKIWNAVATVITFGILVIILGTFVWPKVLGALKEREDFIRDSLETAKRDRDDAQKTLAEYKQQLEKARNEATAIVDEGRRDAEVLRRRLLDDARQEAEATLNRARREIEIARDTAVKDLYTLSGNLATDLAGRILQKEIDPGTHQRLIQESIEQLTRLN